MHDPYKVAGAFARKFGDAEYALKRSSRLRQNKDVAEADWDAFARDLGPDFFTAIVDKGIAKTLIGEPPRRLMNDLQWAPEISPPFTNVHELIVQGVCRVRNSYLHGEKFRGGPDGQWERDVTLIREAHAVLDEAITWWLQAMA
ncbi:hypothetical protein DAH66_15420 [Sphingomonas koreensis]|uniref:RiboL-PSP-HEPN domain-containing protein n=1 Tax=Sphingomonas koreensis TaxID=93064 RepID=A0A430G198_9SPHN|nr:hypothetical protein [Sphingomonas koreensis]RSY81080.1 hypothetical protein DAH66_15420 [Sphingomonas koreensis]